MIGTAVTGVVLAGVVVTDTAQAATNVKTRTIGASDDAYVSSRRTATNFGSADKLVVGTAGGETRTSYVKFDVAALPAGARITGAELNLPLSSKPIAARLTAYPVTGAWTEAEITGASGPKIGAAAGSVLPRTTDTALRIDLSAAVTKAGSYSFALRSAGTDVTRISSTESADGGPRLTITYTPAVPTTNAPTTKPTTVPPLPHAPPPTVGPTTAGPTVAPACTTGVLLVPSCGVLWGAAAGGFTDTPRDTALKNWEQLTGRTSTIFHTYHKGDERFPTQSEIAMTKDATHPRVLMMNWRVDYNTTFAAVAAGGADARIDAEAAYLRANYATQKFFLVIHHEPEDDVVPAAGSGNTATDFAAMYRHTVLRLRADGVTNMVNVLAYMGNEKWMAQSWWKDLYPGDDVVDWIGLDSYVSVEPGYYHFGGFGNLLDRQPTGGGLGFYAWATRTHPSKPIVAAEWGMYHRLAYPTSKAAAFATVLPELAKHPQVKAIVYFDTPSDAFGDRNIAVDSTTDSLAAFRTVAANPIFNVQLSR